MLVKKRKLHIYLRHYFVAFMLFLLRRKLRDWQLRAQGSCESTRQNSKNLALKCVEIYPGLLRKKKKKDKDLATGKHELYACHTIFQVLCFLRLSPFLSRLSDSK